MSEFLVDDYRHSIPGRVARRGRTQDECDTTAGDLAAVVRTLRFMADNEDTIRAAIRAARS